MLTQTRALWANDKSEELKFILWARNTQLKGRDARCLKRQGEVGSCRPLDELVLYGVDHSGRVFSR